MIQSICNEQAAPKSGVAGQQFDYTFNNIGNRTQTKTGGDQNGAKQRTSTYTPNSLNEYSERTGPGYVDIKGISIATNSVTDEVVLKQDVLGRVKRPKSAGNSCWTSLNGAGCRD